METKIAFLFLTIDNVLDPNMWKNYLPDNASIYVHAKYPDKVTGYMKQYLIKSVETSWGHLVLAYLELVKSALTNKLVTHIVFISDSCLPIKPYNDFIKFISSYDQQCSFVDIRDFDLYNFDKSNNVNLTIKPTVKHSGWFCLSRHHAKKLLLTPWKENVVKYNNIIAGDEYFLSELYPSSNIINVAITDVDWDYSKQEINEINNRLKVLYEKIEISEKPNNKKFIKKTKSKIFELRKQKSIIGKHPKTYVNPTEIDIDRFRKSKSFFARKFKNNYRFIDKLISS